MVFSKNPAVWISLIGAALALAIGFGLRISGQQSDLIMTFVDIVIPILVGAATRTQVYPEESVKLALQMQPGTSVEYLNDKLAQQK